MDNSYQQDQKRLSQTHTMQEPQSMVINEDQKESNPIFKVVFNRIRNLKKKLAQIQHIKTLDQKSLKTPQINKLSKEHEVVEEIEKNQEFAKYYKSILIENNLCYDKVDDLLKISTLMAVGNRIKNKEYCPSETRQIYDNYYSNILANKIQGQVSDQVIRIYHILWNYLQNQSHYSQCRDYMTYIEEIDQKMEKQKGNLFIKRKFSDQKMERDTASTSPLKSIVSELNNKMEKLQLKSQIFKIVFDKDIHLSTLHFQSDKLQHSKPVSNQFEKDIDAKQDRSTTNPQGDVQNQQLQVEPSNLWMKKSQSPQESHSDFHSVDHKNVNNVKNRTMKNRQRRNRKKKTVYAEIENVRKCSDTSLEPTPQKHWGKIKYMEKRI